MRRQIAVKHVVSACALVATLALSLVYLYSGVIGQSVTKRANTITVTLDSTGGLFEGSGVTYRGVRVGRVGTIRLDGENVVATAKLNPDREIPADAIAVVRSLSPAGEQFLDIQPRSDGPPYLQNGHLFGKTETATPTSVAKALGSVDRLVGQIDEKDLQTVISELADAFAKPDDLGRLLTLSQNTLRTIDDLWPETLRTLENGKVVLQTGVDKQDEFGEFAKSSRELAGWLRDYDPQLRTIIDTTPAQIEVFRTLVAEYALKLPAVFDDAVSLTDLIAARDPHFRELLKTFPSGAQRLGDTLFDKRFHVNMLVSPGTVCSYGPDPAPPKETTREPLNPDGGCAASFSAQQRGSAHSPPAVR